MIAAYKEHIQFIMILVFMYIMGVWVDPTIYIIFPVVLVLLGIKQRFFELFITAIWMLILSDYIPVANATYQDLQFAKDLKPLIPLTLAAFAVLNRELFSPIPKFIIYFVPFFLVVSLGLSQSINITVGLQKTISYVLMYIMIPIYVNYLHKEQKELFWISLLTFCIGMLTIGVVLGFAIPEIGVLGNSTRFKGVFGNPNAAGFFATLIFILWVVIEEFQLAKITKKERWYILTIIFTTIIWCGSRNALLTTSIFFLTYSLLKINWGITLIVLLSFLVFSDQIFNLFVEGIAFFGLEEFFRVSSLEEGSGRYVAWIFAWDQIQDTFFIGGGFGHDEHTMRPNYYWLQMEGHDGGVHNSYLSMWFDSGIVGVFSYFTAFLTLIFKSIKHNNISFAFAVALLFNITYESWLVASLNPFTIIFLTILTILGQKLVGKNYVPVEKDEHEDHILEISQLKSQTH
ncbi:O-antigen ligase family protein [Paracrocinitomix mangrovi]|uniref:O-antigen ligase family protein n=1 Tax=Paracrocinitomix mangrovi TaxID=2862509 RepID=UPI001C8D43A6|nr:O-antigen ligase family protein [Paracrocinitomix mangrovi]UKN02852.1 O-antigen ligase family protein [Paracrocinitomix mangrovi]